jgi:hypothetical protein
MIKFVRLLTLSGLLPVVAATPAMAVGFESGINDAGIACQVDEGPDGKGRIQS